MKHSEPAVKRSYPADALPRYRVRQRVNQVANDDSECIAEITAA